MTIYIAPEVHIFSLETAIAGKNLNGKTKITQSHLIMRLIFFASLCD